MKTFDSLKSIAQDLNGAPVGLTIGNFDGFHLGHQGLVKELQKALFNQNVQNNLVLTFNPHPLEFFQKVKSIRMFDWEDQKTELEKINVTHLLIEKFDSDYASKTATDFFEGYLLKHLNIKVIRVGHDFHFGKNRQGSLEYLQTACEDHQIDFAIYPAFTFEKEVVSSTLVRKYLQTGQILKANELLGRRFYFRGEVVKGDQRGRLLNFPTANLKPTVDFMIQQGVYKTQTILNGQIFKSATNIGVNKSFQNDGAIKIETHILDFDQDIYGQEIQVEFLDYLRTEQKFNSLDELKNQIKLDVAKCRQ